METADLLIAALRAAASRLPAGDAQKLARLTGTYRPYTRDISLSLYNRLDDEDRAAFVAWMLKRWGGIDSLPAERLAAYDAAVAAARERPATPVTVAGHGYLRRDLGGIVLVGYPETLAVHTIGLDQYRHKGFDIAPGDTVIDGGAFVGDTAVHFHHLTGGNCTVHGFELLAENAALYEENRRLNGIAPEAMRLRRAALAERSGERLVIRPASVAAATRAVAEGDGEAIGTLAIDDYVERERLGRVDLIKLDLEGGDGPALAGALATIRRFRPKLALCLYHRWDDVLTMPALVQATGVAYRYGFKWVHLREGWEAVLLCTPVPAGTTREAGIS